MKHSFVSVGVLALASSLAMPLAAQAQPVYDATDNIWYEAVYVADGLTWGAAETQAQAMGGFLASPTDDTQNQFVYSLVSDPMYWTGLSNHQDILGPWLGIHSTTSGTETFVDDGTGTPLGSYHPWYPGQPDGYGGGTQAADFYSFATQGATWGDTPEDGVQGFTLPKGFVVQFSGNPTAVPEASELSMLLAGLGLVGAMVRRRRPA